MENWNSILQTSFKGIWYGVVDFIPELVVAIVIILVGWLIGGILGKVVSQIIKSIKVDSALRAAKIDEVITKAGWKLDSGAFLGALVKWFVIVVALVAAFDILGLTQVNEFLKGVVLLYLPRVIVAVLVLLVAAVISEAMQRVVSGAAQGAGVSTASFLGTTTKWAIWIFAILAALHQLGIAAPFVQTLFTGVILALAIGFGLAFGLGGQEAASKFIDKVKDEISSSKK